MNKNKVLFGEDQAYQKFAVGELPKRVAPWRNVAPGNWRCLQAETRVAEHTDHNGLMAIRGELNGGINMAGLYITKPQHQYRQSN